MRLRRRLALLLGATALVPPLAAAAAWAMEVNPWAAAAASGALAAAASLALARASITRPIQRTLDLLDQGSQEIAAARYSHRLLAEQPDELGNLVTHFNDMAKGVETSNETLLAMFGDLLKEIEERERQLREAQQQILRSQRLSAIAELAAGVAHEVNNPLQGIMGNAELVSGELPEGPSKQALEEVVESARRIANVTRTLQALATAERSAHVPLELNELVRRVPDVLEAAGNGVAVQLDLSTEPHLVLGHEAALVDLVGHLVRNAVVSMDGRPLRELRLTTRRVEGQAVRLEVADTGCGIPEEHMGRLFNPFFTQNRQRRAQGLGLSLCHRIVEDHGGRISVRSEVDLGTTVSVLLPLAPSAPSLR
ncbi:MAG: HAMP domain-containing protein [Myxococcales bacterium]|nr:HAMP domain-containing protein [Myxococcales bacterium]